MQGKGLFFPRIPDVSQSDIKSLQTDSSRRSGAYNATDFHSSPQDYIDKAVKKYAGNTFILPNQDNPDAEGDPLSSGHKTFFIPKTIEE